MKQNIYDHPEFFSAYKTFRDADKGMNELLEQPVIKRLMKPVKGATVLDLGCGLGHQVQRILEQQPLKITAVDISQKMLTEAQQRITSPLVKWECAAAEEYDFTAETYDIIISSMTMHYVADLKTLFRKIYKALKPGGQMLISMEHPACTAVLKRTDGEQYPVDYANEGPRKQDWFVKDVVKYHRKLATITEEVLEAGLLLKNLEEPTPDKALLQLRPDFEKHVQRPPVLIINALKTIL